MNRAIPYSVFTERRSMSGSSPLDRFGVDGGGPSSGAIEDTGIAVATATELDVEEPPDKKRKLKAPERESKVKHVEDPFDSFRLQDDKKQPSLQLPLPNPKNSFLAQGTAALNMQVANDLTSGNLAAGTKLSQRNNNMVLVADSAVAMAPNVSTAASNPPPPLAMPPPPQQPQQSHQFLSTGIGNPNPFQNQLAAYQAGLLGLPPQFLQQQLIPGTLLPQYAGRVADNFQPAFNMPSTLRLHAATGTSIAQVPLSVEDAAKLSGKPPQSLYMSCDDDSLSEYQCLVRKQVELFEARPEDVASNAKGRNKPIVIGQVGIRCKHCRLLPPKSRQRGATYYPAKLNGLYQAAQSMASGHLCNHCGHIPQNIRHELLVLRERKSSAGGGKKYWGDGVRVLGVYEDENGLRFTKRRNKDNHTKWG